MVGGLTSTLSEHAHLFEHRLRVPSVRFAGRRDAIVPMRDSLLLAERSADPVVLEHGGEHVIPMIRSSRRGAPTSRPDARASRRPRVQLMREELVTTPVGRARLDCTQHTASSGPSSSSDTAPPPVFQATDLQALAQALPPLDFAVDLVTQPCRVEGNPRVSDQGPLDTAWTSI